MKHFFAEATGIVSLVFSIIGFVFMPVGFFLLSYRETFPIGAIFTCVGGLILLAAFAVGFWRFRILRAREELLRFGVATEGTILSMVQNLSVRVNRRHPWIIHYQYMANGASYDGHESLMNLPNRLVIGASIPVVYDRVNPSRSALRTQNK